MILEVENMNDKIIFKKTNTENKDEVDIVLCRGTRFLLDWNEPTFVGRVRGQTGQVHARRRVRQGGRVPRPRPHDAVGHARL